MVLRRMSCAVLAILWVSAAGQAVRAAPLLGVYGPALYDVDTQTGEMSNPRDTGIQYDFVTGIAMSGGGILYGLTSSEYLYTIDPVSGAATQVAGVPLLYGDDLTPAEVIAEVEMAS